MTKLSEELIERLDDQSRRYQSVILTLPEWADIRASLHPAPTAADTPYDPTTQPYDEPFRHVAADTPACFENHHKYVGKCPYCHTELPEAADTVGLVERLTAGLAEAEADGDRMLNAERDAHIETTKQGIEVALRLQAAEQQLAAVSQAIGSVEWMDPPDGGSVTLAEQVERMRLALAAAREQIAELERRNADLQHALDKTGEAYKAFAALTLAAKEQSDADTPKLSGTHLDNLRYYGNHCLDKGTELQKAVLWAVLALTAVTSDERIPPWIKQLCGAREKDAVADTGGLVERLTAERNEAYNRADFNRATWENERRLREDNLARALASEQQLAAAREQIAELTPKLESAERMYRSSCSRADHAESALAALTPLPEGGQ